jgi:hypothetical protein
LLNRRNKRLSIDIEQVKQWARAGATQPEIAQRLKIGLRTFQRWLEHSEYRDEYDGATAELKISLRSKQVALAMAGNATMLIWLGKQLLGQRDNLDHALTGAAGGPIEVADLSGTELLTSRIASVAARQRAGTGPTRVN